MDRLPKNTIRRIALAGLTSILLTLSFPNADQGWLAWIALVPLLLACRGLNWRTAFGLGFLCGILLAFGLYHWLFQVPGFGWTQAFLLAAYVALYPALWCALLSRLANGRISPLVSVPALWVMLDWLRAHAGFLALPWGTLAHSQHENLPVLQLAAVTGEFGVTFMVVLANVLIADILYQLRFKPQHFVGLALIVLVHSVGLISLLSHDPKATHKIAAIQPNISVAEARQTGGDLIRWHKLERLTLSVIKSKPDLVVWPETALRNLRTNPELLGRVESLSQLFHTPILTGDSEFIKFDSAKGGKPRVRSYNAAHYISPKKPAVEPYFKILLVPFGEYLPLESFVRWPRWLVPQPFDSIPGKNRVLFKLLDGTQFAPLICWENLFAEFVRTSVLSGAQILIQIVNDNWFGPTAAPRQHNLASVLRAVENRIPVVIASNSGPSQIIDAHGRILDHLPDLFVEGTTIASIEIRRGRSLYTQFGEFFIFFILAIFVAGMVARKN